MALVGEYFLVRALFLSENIVRRMVLKSGEEASGRVGPQVGQTLEEVMGAIETETQQILDRLSSQQQSKIDSACQYIRFAMADLQAWNDEVERKRQPQAEQSSTLSLNKHLLNVVSNVLTESKYLKTAIWQLRQADEWATEAFNDKKNSSLLVRVEALHIRLFCRALLNWDNRQLWFASWRQVLEPFLTDRYTLRILIGKQSRVSKLMTGQFVPAARLRLTQLVKGLEDLMWRVIMQHPLLVPHAVELAQYVDQQTTYATDLELKSEPTIGSSSSSSSSSSSLRIYLSQGDETELLSDGSKTRPRWRGMLSFHSTYLKLTKNIHLTLYTGRVLVTLKEFRRLAPSEKWIWGVKTDGHLMQINPCDPAEQTSVVNNAGCGWLCPAYASKQRRMYVLNGSDSFLGVFDVTSGQQLSDSIPLPHPVHNQLRDCELLASEDGDLILFLKSNCQTFLRPSTGHSLRWLPVERAIDCDCAYEILSTYRGRLYGLRILDNCLISDRIDLVGDHALIGQSSSCRLQADAEPDVRWHMTIAPSSTEIDHENQIVVVLRQTKTNNSIITVRRMLDTSDAYCFASIQVEQADKYYLDLSTVTCFVMSDEKLYVC